MNRFVVATFFALMIVFLACAAFAADGNLVINRPYQMWPGPSYDLCKDEGDVIQLTDGYTGYQAGRIWVLKPTVGWANPLNSPCVMQFDLGQEATLSELRFYTTGGGAAGVVDVGLRVFVSLDDKSYIQAGERSAPEKPDQGMYRGIVMAVPLRGVRARYVAVAAMAPSPFYFVFSDEIEIIGHTPADVGSSLPVLPAINASGAEGVQAALSGGLRANDRMCNLLAPVLAHIACWPAAEAGQMASLARDWQSRARAASRDFPRLRDEVTKQHRDLARKVYGSDTLIWEVPPDDAFGPLSTPLTLKPIPVGSIDTAVNALEATAFGVANLGTEPRELRIKVRAVRGGPRLTARTGRFFESTNAMYVADALLADDCAQTIPSGESRMVWVEAETTGCKPGTYRSELAVTLDGKPIRVPLTVNVRNVVLSRKTSLATGNWSYLDGGGDVQKLVAKSMLAHRITVGACSSGPVPFPKKDPSGNAIRPMEMDYAAMDAAMAFHKGFDQMSWFFPMDYTAVQPAYDWFGASAWMSNEFKSVFGEWLKAFVARIKRNGRGYDRFYLQMFDETLDSKVGEICRLVHSIDPKVRMMITIPHATSEAVKGLADSGMNVFVYHAPILNVADPPDGFPLLRSGGRELWLYVATGEAGRNGRERDPLYTYRLVHWKAFVTGATGVHFWNQLNNITSGWQDDTANTYYWPQVYPIGGTFPSPPPDVNTKEKVVPSRRWEYQRMGIEDYMLLKMAADRIAALGDRGSAYKTRLDRIVGKAVAANRPSRTEFRLLRVELLKLVEGLPKR